MVGRIYHIRTLSSRLLPRASCGFLVHRYLFEFNLSLLIADTSLSDPTSDNLDGSASEALSIVLSSICFRKRILACRKPYRLYIREFPSLFIKAATLGYPNG